MLLDEHTAALDPGTAEKVLNLTKRIVEEHQLTCLMITHNMQSALDLGNRILMMDSGDIVLDIHEEEKKGLTVEGLLEKFKTGAGKMLDNDRILLSGENVWIIGEENQGWRRRRNSKSQNLSEQQLGKLSSF